MGQFALSVVGRDRPGIVAEVSRVLFELGCNIEDSTCTILSGQFAMILVIAHPKFSSRRRSTPSSTRCGRAWSSRSPCTR